MSNKKRFKRYVKKYIKLFALYNWELYFQSAKSKQWRALTSWHTLEEIKDGCGQIVTIFYDEKWLNDAKKKELEVVAFHEVLEILLSKLRDYSNNKTEIIPTYVVDNEIHNIIRIFENKIYQKVR